VGIIRTASPDCTVRISVAQTVCYWVRMILRMNSFARLQMIIQFFPFITKNFCVLHNTVEHNYISPSSTVGILHVSALYVGHLQVVI